jgi:nucleoside-triphosphatase THEP1/ABC-type thiamin/hydroxymethylpyrimidine transport system permease subunit
MLFKVSIIDTMNRMGTGPANSLTYYRLIALWVLCEAMLGGIIHGLKLPVSGLLVGSCAVICICLLAWYVPKKGAILKATIIVAIFKMMLSPQAPPPAYIAVFFQGLLGELLFWKKRFYTLCCILLAVLSLLESGLQRILVLTIVYGNDIWKVINNFINGLTKQKETTNYSLWIGAGYVGLHFITGILVGWWAALLPHKVEKWKMTAEIIITGNNTAITIRPPSKKKRKFRKGIFIIWILLVALYVQSYFKIGTPLLPSHISLKILLRSLIIVLAWVFIIGPVLKQLLHTWLQKKKTASQPDIQKVLELLPATQNLVAESWKRSSVYKGWKRISSFSKTVVVNSLTGDHSYEKQGNIYILTGPVQSGKTTSLLSWVKERKDVSGILTPVIEGKRFFYDISSSAQWPMEATTGEETLLAGRFVFSKAGFEKAVQMLQNSMNQSQWLLIDEVGPLEIRGEGFSAILKQVLLQHRNNLLLVVREGLAGQVVAAFDIHNAVIINSSSQLPA